MNTIVDRVKIPNKPIGEQLSREDLARFSEVRQRMMGMNLAALIESRRERDLEVLRELVQIADQNYRWQEDIEERDPKYFLQGILYVWRFMSEAGSLKTEITQPEPYCSVEMAIHRLEVEGFTRINQLDLTQAERSLDKLTRKYGKPIDRKKLLPLERDVYDKILTESLRPAERERQFIHDLESIKTMATASTIVYEADSRDVAYSGGNIDAIGTTIAERAKQNVYDERTMLAIGLWRKINEKIPAPITKEWEQIGNAVKALEERTKR